MLLIVLSGILSTSVYSQNVDKHHIEVEKAAVATAHSLASQIGLEMLENGGNAVDAAIAAAYAIGVLEPSGSGIGGGVSAIIYIKEEDKYYNLDFYPRAPEKPMRNFDPENDIPTVKSIAIPGFIHGMEEMRERWAKLDPETLISPSVEIAKEGFVPDSVIYDILSVSIDKLSKYDESRAIFTDSGRDPGRNVVIKNEKLAELMEAVIKEGRDAFYSSERTQSMVKQLNQLGASFTFSDFENYNSREFEPVSGSYRGYNIISAAPPQSGTLIIQTLHMIEALDINDYGDYRKDPNALHLLFEIFKRSYADRLGFLADPDFVEVPIQALTSKEYARHRLQDINRVIAFPENLRDTDPGNAFAFNQKYMSSDSEYQIQNNEGYPKWSDEDYEGAPSYEWWGDDLFDSWGTPRRGTSINSSGEQDTLQGAPVDTLDIFDDNVDYDEYEPVDESQTSHINVIDEDGNMVSLTTTIGHFYGSGITIDGVLMNSAMANFGSTNPVNLVGPNKTPRSTIAPTILTKDGKPKLIIGSAGGGRIPAAIVLGIHNILDLGMSSDQANASPRFLSRRWADTIEIEGGFSNRLIRQMRGRGHPITVMNEMDRYFGGMQIIHIREDGVIEASSDPRRDGKPAGY